MDNFIELLQKQLESGKIVDQLSNKIGADKEQTEIATNSIVSMLTDALAKNAATPAGASSLASALDNDHDGSILDHIGDLVNGNLANNRAANGAGILKHILGAKQGNAADIISQLSGLSGGKAGDLMKMLAPIVLGMLGKQKRQSNLDQGGLSDMLSRSVKTASNQGKQMGIIGKLLDRDGDGNVMDDIADLGMKALGGLFKRR